MEIKIQNTDIDGSNRVQEDNSTRILSRKKPLLTQKEKEKEAIGI